MKRKKKKWLLIVLVVILAVVFVKCAASADRGKLVSNAEWNETKIGRMLPYPGPKKMEIQADTEESFRVYVKKYSKEKQEDYFEKCKEAGFTTDVKQEGPQYRAYTEEGYRLQVSFSDYDHEMTIDLSAPIEMGKLKWPSSQIGKQLPVPSSKVGKITSESTNQLFVYVGDTSRDDYEDYVEACAEKGFTENYSKDDDYYHAENAGGYSLSLKYEGYQTMRIELYGNQNSETSEAETVEPEEPEEEKPEEAPKNSGAQTNGSAVDPDLKAFLDEYEAFMDQYVEFMRTYAESDNTAELLAEYSKMMKQYVEFAEEADEYKEDEMSTADLSYYLEVANRINQKLLEIA